MKTPDVTVERSIAAAPLAVWSLVSDVARMGEWSPETTGCEWTHGATGPAVGARFTGRNRKGSRTWATTCTVGECEPGGVFAFDVTAGPFAVATWRYELEAAGEGCVVRESWTDNRSWLAKQGGWVLSGVRDRGEHNRAGMVETLGRLAAAAESAGSRA